MKKLDGQSYDNVHERIEALKEMFPEAVSEGRLDYDTLMALLGGEFDNDQEKYSFTWNGKLNALRLAQKRSTGTLYPVPRLGIVSVRQIHREHCVTPANTSGTGFRLLSI